MIGPCQRDDSPIGGCATAFELLIEALSKNSAIELDVVSTARPQAGRARRLISALRSFWQIRSRIASSDVVALFSTNTSLLRLTRIVGYLSRKHGKPLLVRKFGGISHRELANGPLPTKIIEKLCRELCQVSIYIPETLYAYNVGLEDNLPVAWMPNYRKISDLPSHSTMISHSGCKFVYIGQVRPEKGLRDMLDAAKYLYEDVSVDVYGPLMEGMSESEFSVTPNIRYGGVLQPSEVIETLRRYNAFVFPSRHEGEGHPGSLIEAFSVGLPAVTTNWKFIPEVADESCAIFVEPGDSKALADAMNRLAADRKILKSMGQAAIKRSLLFDVSAWADIFARILIFLAKGQSLPPDLTTPEKLMSKLQNNSQMHIH